MEGGKRMPGLRELPGPMRVAFPGRAGMGMREMLYGMEPGPQHLQDPE